MRIFLLFLSISINFSAGGWQENLASLLKAPESQQETLLKQILEEKPEWHEVAAYLESIRFPLVEEKGKAILGTTLCKDGIERPWVLYIPSRYRADEPTPLLVILHGGVSRAKIIEDPVKYAEESAFTELAEEKGWLALYPFGQSGATWWDDVGMSNIRSLIRRVKREYNVDDDRVWMGGFSDGASASFLYAMVDPNDFAAFVALNGHMGVGSLDGNLPTYAANFFNTPLYAITTFDDPLYPSEKMRPTILMALRAGGVISYREHEGGHELSYKEQELPRIARFLERHPRDPFPSQIVWETAESRFGLCRWFAIDRVTTEEPAPWHKDYNVALVDDRVTIGFFPDDTYEGPGVRVGKVMEDTPAEEMGMESGDVILKGGKKMIKDMGDLLDYKATLNRGDSIELVVKRDDEELLLKGRLPEPENYLVFKREKPSALAKVSFMANRIEIQASRVGAFRVLVHPDMIQLDQPLLIRVNGKEVFNAKVKPDTEFLLRNFLRNRDRRLLYVAEVKVEL